MKKILLFVSILIAANIARADCPNLVGRYSQCYSEITKVKGDYIIDQYQENTYEVYNVEYIDDETGENRKDLIKTNSQNETRKETLPRIGVKVRLEAKSHCADTSVVTDADAYFLGAKVGSFISSISRQKKSLISKLDGSYLGKEVHKIIICTLEE